MFMESLISVSGDCNLVRDGVLSPKDKQGHHDSQPTVGAMFLEKWTLISEVIHIVLHI